MYQVDSESAVAQALLLLGDINATCPSGVCPVPEPSTILGSGVVLGAILVLKRNGDGEAKFWLEPEIELARNYSLSRQQLKVIENIIEERQNEIRNAWQKYFPS